MSYRCILGMVQGWDPDIDLRAVGRQRSSSFDTNMNNNNDASNLQLIVCVNSNAASVNRYMGSDSDQHLEAFTLSDVFPGTRFSLTVLG